MQKRHSDRESYFEEQIRTTQNYYIPYIKNYIGSIPSKVLEVGCGEGGNLLPFAQMGCDVYGVDMAVSRIEQARRFFAQKGLRGTFFSANIFELDELHTSFPLIIVHDVIEHIDDKLSFLSDLRKFLAPGGSLFIAFPAWQMPFGGHQQIARGGLISRLPFIHLLPVSAYRALLRAMGERADVINELLSVKRTRCTIETFLSVVHNARYRVINEQLYFINPHYETKFGLKPRKLNRIIARLPYLRNFFSTSCFYILKSE